MCFCHYKGIFHSVMLINLISKSRNMKQELKKQTSTVAGCAPVWFEPIFVPPQLFSFSNGERFQLGMILQTYLQKGFKGEHWCYHGACFPFGDINRSQWFPIGMILHAGRREKATGPSNGFHHHHPKGPLLESYFDILKREGMERFGCIERDVGSGKGRKEGFQKNVLRWMKGTNVWQRHRRKHGNSMETAGMLWKCRILNLHNSKCYLKILLHWTPPRETWKIIQKTTLSSTIKHWWVFPGMIDLVRPNTTSWFSDGGHTDDEPSRCAVSPKSCCLI